MFIEAHPWKMYPFFRRFKIWNPDAGLQSGAFAVLPAQPQPVSKRKAVDNASACLYSLLPFAIQPAIDVGLWLSLVERFVRDEEAAGSNPASPTTSKRWWLQGFRAMIACGGKT